MLNLGAEYAWLDVLCLRQKGGLREDLREEEWKVNVPTIGSVYGDAKKVVCYLSGLGRPLSSDADNLESDRCWFKRAWTLQEISRDPIIGRDTGDEQLRAKFKGQLLSLQDIRGGNVYDVLSEMQKRVSTHPVDKIAGMAYLMGSESIPAYYGKQSEEDAWIALIDVTANWCQPDFLFLHPKPGTKSWRPSWKQVMTEKLPLKGKPAWGSSWIKQLGMEKAKTSSFNDGYIIESALVRGLSEGNPQGQERHGKLVEDNTGTHHTFKIVTHHQYPIPDGLYTLLGADSKDFRVLLHWVVGRRLPDRRLMKLSVFQMYEDTEFARLSLYFEHDLPKYSHITIQRVSILQVLQLSLYATFTTPGTPNIWRIRYAASPL
ncbi:hypothetical protein ARMSODRAFT_1013780 [Armillaria solidipes]|uniref:Heterokaryon incompatibility domain-containing protein n=1 Tax=Armillaria solidipes TaxID=1076256 RepID=A0A2H3CF72_9AGAR|nr:hypothetical protein ARMSODRAFT_1013780 [Armillaria solidipes]